MNDADHEEFVTMHVISKNLQSIRSDRRLEDLISEIGLCNFDLMCNWSEIGGWQPKIVTNG